MDIHKVCIYRRSFVCDNRIIENSDEVRLYRILDISLSRTLLQKIFGMGTIAISSADKTMGNFNLVNVKNPVQVKEQLSKLIEENRDKKRVTNREYMHDDLEDDDEQ